MRHAFVIVLEGTLSFRFRDPYPELLILSWIINGEIEMTSEPNMTKPTTMAEAVCRLGARFVAALGVSLLAAATTASGRTVDASPWDGDSRGAARLIAGNAVGASDAPIVRAGIEIRLGPGWKTYWRYPGDAGVPPIFDFARSGNVKAITVLWPAPHRFSIEGATSIGYKGNVILPLRVVPQNPGQPVVLRLKLGYGICEKLCVPAEAEAELVLSGAASSHERALAAAEARVPKPSALGEDRAFAIRAVRRETGSTRPRIVIDVSAPATASVDIFAEGPTPDWALPLPEPVSAAPTGLRRFVFELDGLPSGAKPEGVMLKLTAVSGEDAIQVSIPVD